MKRQYMSGLVLSLVFLAPSIFADYRDEKITLLNSSMYTLNVEIAFKCQPSNKDRLCKQNISLAAGKDAIISFPTYSGTSAGGNRSSGNHWLDLIKATVPAQKELIWEGGKVGGKVVGEKITRAEASVVYNTPDGQGRTFAESLFFVINANRIQHLINNIEHVKDLKIYRFIQ